MLPGIKEYSKKLGIGVCVEIDSAALVPEERIRKYCEENKCGCYGRNYTCPPNAGSLEEIKESLKNYSHGYLFQYSKELDLKKDFKKILKSKDDFHKIILKLEDYMQKGDIEDVWGLIGGNCGLCHVCAIQKDKPCRHPDKSRKSLEAIGIDVVGLLNKLDLDSHFHQDRITWTGCILY
jgi:predicted metal-binding protein